MTSLLAYLHNCLLECLHDYMLTFLHACLVTSNAYLIAGPSTCNRDYIPNCGAQILCEAHIQ